jgi:hypothetical protein
MKVMDLFREFWWLLFPICGIAFGAFRRWLDYCARRDAVALIKTYAAAGQEAPPELVAKLNLR